MPTWASSTLSACLRQADAKTRTLTNQALIKHELGTIVKETGSVGKTPANTMSRTLQDLRDCGLVQFLERGKYKLTELCLGHTAKAEDTDSGKAAAKATAKSKKRSKGERLLAEVLKELGFDFIEEKTFPGLVGAKKSLRFDVYFEVGSRGFLIEFDGIQHKKPVAFFGGEAQFMKQQLYDQLKTAYCEQRKDQLSLLRVETLDPKKLKKQVRQWLVSTLLHGPS